MRYPKTTALGGTPLTPHPAAQENQESLELQGVLVPKSHEAAGMLLSGNSAAPEFHPPCKHPQSFAKVLISFGRHRRGVFPQ